jgi:hypothetical protein
VGMGSVAWAKRRVPTNRSVWARYSFAYPTFHPYK